MLRDKVKKYYLDEGHNCAESMLLAANEEYDMGLSENETSLMRGFGGGMGFGITCGAISGSIAALGKLICVNVDKDTAHGVTGGFIGEFEKRFGSTRCDALVPQYKKDDIRCYELLLMVADLLEETIAKYRV